VQRGRLFVDREGFEVRIAGYGQGNNGRNRRDGRVNQNGENAGKATLLFIL